MPNVRHEAMASREAGSHLQDDVLRHSLDKPEEFWARHAERLYWHKRPTQTLRRTRRTLKNSNITHDAWEWFPGGEISTCYNCIDRHVQAGRGDNVAVYYDSPVSKTKQTYTYSKLLDEVEVLAGALREEGVRRGDVVMLYSELSSPAQRLTVKDCRPTGHNRHNRSRALRQCP